MWWVAMFRVRLHWLAVCAAFVLLTVSQVHGQGFELDAPTTAEPGTLVILDASVIPATGRTWQAVNAPAESFRIVDDGERLVFATAKPGRYWFVFSFTEDVSELVVELQDTQRELFRLLATDEPKPDELKTAFEALATITERFILAKSQPQTLVHELTIEGEIQPDDPDTPTPLPDGRYKLATLSRAEAAKLPEKTQAGTVAGVYRAIAAQIQAGALKGDREILASTATKLRDRLGEDFDAWKPWGLAISQRLSDLYESGELKTDEEFATAYGEIALGLEAI